MLATVLRGELAEQQSIFIMRAFKEMRHYIRQFLKITSGILSWWGLIIMRIQRLTIVR